MNSILNGILTARGLTGEILDAYLRPNYDDFHDPYLLPDMTLAVERIVRAFSTNEKIMIYGDYDIDGLTATTLLLDALQRFGFETVDAFIPNRFVEGYGMTIEAVERIAKTGATLIITVDCGSLSEKEIIRAGELGVDVIVTDHHNVATIQPPAVAIINPKRLDHDYPFIDLAGVGVAFKLVQALQTKLEGIPNGQEKWLLDLVALGTVCDVVSLVDENRSNVYWGLKVLAKTKRPGLRALMAVAGVEVDSINSRTLGFVLGPRLNAAGRLETAQIALDLLLERSGKDALDMSRQLDELNKKRRIEQDEITKEAVKIADQLKDDPVLVISGAGWNHGVVGIVAAKITEKYKKPTFVLSEVDDETKGSARSYGDFSAAEAINYAKKVVTKGGGHKLAAGVTLPTSSVGAFREKVNEYYKSLKLKNQPELLLAQSEATIEIEQVSVELINEFAVMEPFGNGNPEPILKLNDVFVTEQKKLGTDKQHVKLTITDRDKHEFQMIAFNAQSNFFVNEGEHINVWFRPIINEWRGRVSVEGRLLRVELV